MPMTPEPNRLTSSLPPPCTGLEASPSAIRSCMNSKVSTTLGSSALAEDQLKPPERFFSVG